jgi:sortase A
MATQPRPSRSSNNQDSLDLLQSLLEAPLFATDLRLQPIALRSTVEQRRYALRHYSLRTWVDTLLHRAEWLLMLVTLMVFGYWLADGPLRDWLHTRQQAAVQRAPAAMAAAPPLASRSALVPTSAPGHAALLPYTTPDMAGDAPTIDFMAPRGHSPAAPIAIAPQPTRLLIPALALDTPVKEVFIIDGVWEVAEYAAGYLHGTSLPGGGNGGEGSNTVLAGHAGLRGAVFGNLGALSTGDDIYLDAGGWRYHYRVRDMKSVWPTQVEILDSTSTPVLTLLTCTNWDTQRLVVVADLVGSKPLPGA